MNTTLILTEAIVEVGELLGTEIHNLYLSGANDTRVNYDSFATALAIVYGVDSDPVEKDLVRIAQAKQAKLHADLVARVTGEEMIVDHGHAMTEASKAAVRERAAIANLDAAVDADEAAQAAVPGDFCR